MGQQIILQPNGKLAMFSSVVDGITIYDATEEEIVDDMIEKERRHLTEQVRATVEKLLAGGKPSAQFTLTWEEALAKHNENFPDDPVMLD